MFAVCSSKPSWGCIMRLGIPTVTRGSGSQITLFLSGYVRLSTEERRSPTRDDMGVGI